MPECREQKEVRSLLKEHGAKLERTKKHKVYRFPSGRIWVTPSTPSGAFNWRNTLAELKTFLGLVGKRGETGLRRPKKAKGLRHPLEIESSPVPVQPDLVQQMGCLKFERRCFECHWRIVSPNPSIVQLCALCRIFLDIYVVNGRSQVGAAWKYVKELHVQAQV